MVVLFVGSIGLTQYFAVIPRPNETVLSALARTTVGTGAPHIIVQVATLLILTVAANTSFAGFPGLASILARDGYLPRQLATLGDRLVFANGIMLLSGLTALLIVAFGASTHSLIPLFAVGVFLAFTLSQAGMVFHWVRERGRGWCFKALLNGLGALTTAVTLGIVAVSKFVEGAWIVMVLVPLLVLAFRAVRTHYGQISGELTMRGLPPCLLPLPSQRVVVPISGVHRGVIEAVRYARSISDKVTAVYVEINPGAGERVRREWEQWECDIPLVIVSSPYRSIVGPFLDFLDHTDQEHNDGQMATVVLPQFIPAKWWEHLLHNQTAWLLKVAMLYRRRRLGRGRAIIDVPFYLRH